MKIYSSQISLNINNNDTKKLEYILLKIIIFLERHFLSAKPLFYKIKTIKLKQKKTTSVRLTIEEVYSYK